MKKIVLTIVMIVLLALSALVVLISKTTKPDSILEMNIEALSDEEIYVISDSDCPKNPLTYCVINIVFNGVIYPQIYENRVRR